MSLSLPRSDGSCDGQAGGTVGPQKRWPNTHKGELENNTRKSRDLDEKMGILTA